MSELYKVKIIIDPYEIVCAADSPDEAEKNALRAAKGATAFITDQYISKVERISDD